MIELVLQLIEELIDSHSELALGIGVLIYR
jgi:hypothetical protein